MKHWYSNSLMAASSNNTPRVVCFGYVNPGTVFAVEQYPAANTGAYVTDKRPFIGADCAMAAQMLAQWGMDAHLIGNALGDDALGHGTVNRLREMGVRTHIDLRADLRTPDEVDISDRAGTRTFFVEDNPAVWNSLLEADLSAIDDAAMLYVDWYVGEAATRAVAYAHRRDVPVYLNVEFSLHDPSRYGELISRAAYVQSPMSDVHVKQEDPHAMVMTLCDMGVKAAFVTRGKYGSLAMGSADRRLLEIPAPAVEVVDTQGAGAVYSALAMYGLLGNWPLDRVAWAATVGASLKCAQYGLLHMPVDDIVKQATRLASRDTA